jgi:hypothetical protein
MAQGRCAALQRLALKNFATVEKDREKHFAFLADFFSLRKPVWQPRKRAPELPCEQLFSSLRL